MKAAPGGHPRLGGGVEISLLLQVVLAPVHDPFRHRWEGTCPQNETAKGQQTPRVVGTFCDPLAGAGFPPCRGAGSALGEHLKKARR